MPKGYRHQTHEERGQISALKESGLSDGATAAWLAGPWPERRRQGGRYSRGEARERTEPELRKWPALQFGMEVRSRLTQSNPHTRIKAC